MALGVAHFIVLAMVNRPWSIVSQSDFQGIFESVQ